MATSAIPEELVTFLYAISEDESLSTWLVNLRQLPLDTRTTALEVMAAQMREANEDPVVVAAVSALSRPEIYDAACRTLIEIRGA